MIDLNKASSVAINSNTNRKIKRALSGKSIITPKTYQYFTIDADFNSMQLADIRLLLDYESTISIQLPSTYNQSNDRTATSGSLGADTIDIDTTGLSAGGLVKFNNHNKLYTITQIVSGSELKLYPNLLANVDSVILKSSNIVLDVHPEQDLSYQVSFGGVGSLTSITFSEDL